MSWLGQIVGKRCGIWSLAGLYSSSMIPKPAKTGSASVGFIICREVCISSNLSHFYGFFFQSSYHNQVRVACTGGNPLSESTMTLAPLPILPRSDNPQAFRL